MQCAANLSVSIYITTVCRYNLGTYESEIFVRIKSRIESEYSRLRVIGLIITDEQRCANSPGSSNNIARSLLQC